MSLRKFSLYSIHDRHMRASVQIFKSRLPQHFHNKNYVPDNTEHAALQFYNIAGFTFFSPMNMVQQNILLFFLLHSLSIIFAFAVFSFHSIRLVFFALATRYLRHTQTRYFIFQYFSQFFFQFPISMVHQSLMHSKQMEIKINASSKKALTNCFGTNTSFLFRNRNRPTHNTMNAGRTTKKSVSM